MMRIHPKLLVAGTIAAFALALGAASAGAARSIRLTNVPAGETLASGQLSFHAAEEEANQVICNVTLLRTVSTLIPKRTGVLFGRVTGIEIDRGIPELSHCIGAGTVTEIREIIPLTGTHRQVNRSVLLYDLRSAGDRLWKLVYDSIGGTLPNIENINFHIERVLIELRFRAVIDLGCLYEGDAFGEISVVGGVITRARSAGSPLRRVRGTFGCPANGQLDGSFTIEPTNIRISLL